MIDRGKAYETGIASMKPPVSLDYLIVVMLLAGAAAVLSFVAPNPAYNLTALMVGVYAMHLVSLRVVVRQYAGGGKKGKRAIDAENVIEIRELREQLELEHAEVENRKAELQQRIEAAEEQWKLLRQMIQDRVGEGPKIPGPVRANEQTAWATQTTPSAPTKGSHSPEAQPRVHGRW